MLKISNYALTMAILTHAGRASAACEGDISSFTDECTYANFIASLNEDCDVNVLFADPDLTTEEQVEELCAYDAPVQFVEIQGTYQKDRRYFAGGGILVDGEDWNIDSAQIQRFETNLGARTLISWPEYAARYQYNIDNDLGDNGYPANMNLDTSCDLNTVMCCFTDDTKMNSFAANGDSETDVCRHDLYDSPQSNHIKEGWSIFPDSETSTHCVGFTWSEGEELLPANLLGNMMYDVSLRNTINKGYLKGVPGAPMCGCIEHMPVVEKAACRTASKTGGVTYTFSYDAEEGVTASNSANVQYADCADPDLASQYKAQHGDDKIDAHLVGDGGCADDLEDYLNDEQFLHQGQHLTKYVTPDPAKWSDIVVGEGIYFQPPDINPLDADADFRALIEGGCKDEEGGDRYCIIYRNCASCSSDEHRHIFYKRLTPLPSPGTNSTAGEVYFLDMFMNQWKSYENILGEDFELYSSYADATAGKNAWTYCNYDYHGIGFPRDCGPKGYMGNQWNSYTVHGHGSANHHGFYVEKPQA